MILSSGGKQETEIIAERNGREVEKWRGCITEMNIKRFLVLNISG